MATPWRAPKRLAASHRTKSCRDAHLGLRAIFLIDPRFSTWPTKAFSTWWSSSDLQFLKLYYHWASSRLKNSTRHFSPCFSIQLHDNSAKKVHRGYRLTVRRLKSLIVLPASRSLLFFDCYWPWRRETNVTRIVSDAIIPSAQSFGSLRWREYAVCKGLIYVMQDCDWSGDRR